MEATSHIKQSILEFAANNLSQKSYKYISEELFIDQYYTDEVVAENRKEFPSEPSDIIIGELDEIELQLFVITISLSKRIDGTKGRMGEVDSVSILAPASVIESAKELYSKRYNRLQELKQDYTSSFHYLNNLIFQTRKEQVEISLAQNPHIYKKIFNGFHSGFDFEIVAGNKIKLVNNQILGGD